MQTQTVISFVVLALGILISILGWASIFGEGSGYVIMGIGIPFIVAGLIFLLSLTGGVIMVVGSITYFVMLLVEYSFGIWIGLALILIGLIYGIVEKTMKSIKKDRR